MVQEKGHLIQVKPKKINSCLLIQDIPSKQTPYQEIGSTLSRNCSLECINSLQCYALLAFMALSAAQSSAQTYIHSVILVIDTPNNASYSPVHWLIRTLYLSIKASNELTERCSPLPLMLASPLTYAVHPWSVHCAMK